MCKYVWFLTLFRIKVDSAYNNKTLTFEVTSTRWLGNLKNTSRQFNIPTSNLKLVHGAEHQNRLCQSKCQTKKQVFVVKLQQNHGKTKMCVTIFDTWTGTGSSLKFHNSRGHRRFFFRKTNGHWWHVCKNVSADKGKDLDEIWPLTLSSKQRDQMFLHSWLQEQNKPSVAVVMLPAQLERLRQRRLLGRRITLNHLLRNAQNIAGNTQYEHTYFFSFVLNKY